MDARETLVMHLHLNSGVPVVRVAGTWTDTTRLGLQEVVSRLMRAGHLEVIVSLVQMRGVPVADRNWMDSLCSLAASLKSRCGRLDVVGTAEQVKVGIRAEQNSFCCSCSSIKWATTEEEAVCHVKGVPNGAFTPLTSLRARLDAAMPQSNAVLPVSRKSHS